VSEGALYGDECTSARFIGLRSCKLILLPFAFSEILSLEDKVSIDLFLIGSAVKSL